MSLVAKFALGFLIFAAHSVKSEPTYILLIDQQAKDQCHKFDSTHFNERPIVRPNEGQDSYQPKAASTCTGVDPNIDMEKVLSEEHGHSAREFRTLSIDYISKANWSTETNNDPRIKYALEKIKKQNITFRYGIYANNAGLTERRQLEYIANLEATLRTLTFKLNVRKWLVADPVTCAQNSKTQRFAAITQRKSSNAYQYRRYPGPIISDLFAMDELGRCKLKDGMKTELASRWEHAIDQANERERKLDYESLLFLFK
jgi:hypothetical protein